MFGSAYINAKAGCIRKRFLISQFLPREMLRLGFCRVSRILCKCAFLSLSLSSLSRNMPKPRSGGNFRDKGVSRGSSKEHSTGGFRNAWAGGDYHQDEGHSNSSEDEATPAEVLEAQIPIRLAMWDLGQCDRKRCTGTRLVHQRVVGELRLGQPFPGTYIPEISQACLKKSSKNPSQ